MCARSVRVLLLGGEAANGAARAASVWWPRPSSHCQRPLLGRWLRGQIRSQVDCELPLECAVQPAAHGTDRAVAKMLRSVKNPTIKNPTMGASIPNGRWAAEVRKCEFPPDVPGSRIQPPRPRVSTGRAGENKRSDRPRLASRRADALRDALGDASCLRAGGYPVHRARRRASAGGAGA